MSLTESEVEELIDLREDLWEVCMRLLNESAVQKLVSGLSSTERRKFDRMVELMQEVDGILHDRLETDAEPQGVTHL